MITDILETKRSKEELRIALDVVKEFKGGEDEIDWLFASFESWVKLEQLEEFLEHLVERIKTIDLRRQRWKVGLI